MTILVGTSFRSLPPPQPQGVFSDGNRRRSQESRPGGHTRGDMAGQTFRFQVPAGAVPGSVVQIAADGNVFHCRLPEHSFPGQELFFVRAQQGASQLRSTAPQGNTSPLATPFRPGLVLDRCMGPSPSTFPMAHRSADDQTQPPPGWTAVSGQDYRGPRRSFIGPNGERARSLPEAWRNHRGERRVPRCDRPQRGLSDGAPEDAAVDQSGNRYSKQIGSAWCTVI